MTYTAIGVVTWVADRSTYAVIVPVFPLAALVIVNVAVTTLVGSIPVPLRIVTVTV